METTSDRQKTNRATNELTDRRVTVAEAAVLLGLSEDAVRSRLKRGTLRKEKDRAGTVLVVLGNGGRYDRKTDRPSTDQPTDPGDLSDMVGNLRDQVSFLRQQLEQEREANRENRRIIAGLVQRVPALDPGSSMEASSEPPDGPVRASEGATRGTAAPSGSQKDPTEPHRSWWRRWLFSES